MRPLVDQRRRWWSTLDIGVNSNGNGSIDLTNVQLRDLNVTINYEMKII